jgi:hypothetical protein
MPATEAQSYKRYDAPEGIPDCDIETDNQTWTMTKSKNM